MISKALPLLMASFLLINPKGSRVPPRSNDSQFTYNQVSDYYVITGVQDDYLSKDELRIYGKEYDEDHRYVKEVAADALDTASYTTIMISKDVETFGPSLNNKIVYYTGTEDEFEVFVTANSIDVTKISALYYQACDEGFIRFWETEIKTLPSICDILTDKPLLNKMFKLYDQLDITLDKKVVDEYETEDTTIKELVKYIESLVDPDPEPAKKSELSQNTMMTFILAIAGIGMTSITIFYLLKDKKIIE